MEHFLIIGYGGAGKRFAINLQKISPNFKISVLHITSTTNTLHNTNDIVKHLYSIDEALAKKYDGIIISTPTSEHLKYAELFINHAKFFLIDKPLDSDLNTCITFYNKYKNASAKIYVNFQRRYAHCWHELKQKIIQNQQQDGVFRYGLIHVNSYLPSWRPNQDFHSLYAARKDLGGGVLLTECHEIDLVEWIFGDIKEVYATLQQTPAYGLTVEDAAHMTVFVQTPQGLKPITFILDFMSASLYRTSIFEFSNNRYEIDEMNDCCHDIKNTCKNNTLDKKEPHLALLTAVYDTLNNKIEYSEIPSIYNGLRVNAVIEAAKLSNKEKKQISITIFS